MRDYSRTNNLEEDSDAVMMQMKDMLEGKPTARAPLKAPQKLPKGTNLALALVHSLRGQVRGIGGLDAPEELVLETRLGKRALPVIQKARAGPVPEAKPEPVSVPVVEPEPEIKPVSESVPVIEPEPGPEPELEPEPLEPDTKFASESVVEPEPEKTSKSVPIVEPEPEKAPESVPEPAPVIKAEPLLEHAPHMLPELVKVPEPKTILSAGDDEGDEDDEPGEEGEDDEEEEDEAPMRKSGKSKKLLLKLLKRIARRRKRKNIVRVRKSSLRSRGRSKTARSAHRRSK